MHCPLDPAGEGAQLQFNLVAEPLCFDPLHQFSAFALHCICITSLAWHLCAWDDCFHHLCASLFEGLPVHICLCILVLLACGQAYSSFIAFLARPPVEGTAGSLYLSPTSLLGTTGVLSCVVTPCPGHLQAPADPNLIGSFHFASCAIYCRPHRQGLAGPNLIGPWPLSGRVCQVVSCPL